MSVPFKCGTSRQTLCHPIPDETQLWVRPSRARRVHADGVLLGQARPPPLDLFRRTGVPAHRRAGAPLAQWRLMARRPGASLTLHLQLAQLARPLRPPAKTPCQSSHAHPHAQSWVRSLVPRRQIERDGAR